DHILGSMVGTQLVGVVGVDDLGQGMSPVYDDRIRIGARLDQAMTLFLPDPDLLRRVVVMIIIAHPIESSSAIASGCVCITLVCFTVLWFTVLCFTVLCFTVRCGQPRKRAAVLRHGPPGRRQCPRAQS